MSDETETTEEETDGDGLSNDPSPLLDNLDDPKLDIAVAGLSKRAREQIGEAEDGVGEIKEINRWITAVVEFAAESDFDAQSVLDKAKESAGGIAQVTGRKKEKLIRDLSKTAAESDKIDRLGDVSLDDELGFDSFLEDHTKQIEIRRSTDHVADPEWVWKFEHPDDGSEVSLELDDNTHLYPKSLYQAVAGALPGEISRRFASEEMLEILDDEMSEDVAEDIYAVESVGPSSRPWSRNDTDKWTEAINSLVDERKVEPDPVPGRRTQALEHLMSRVSSSRAVRDLSDAISEEIAFLPGEDTDGDDDATDDIWVPNAWAAEAIDELELDWRYLQSEVAARGADSDALPGQKVSEEVSAGGEAARFWRFKRAHDDVAEPDDTVSETKDAGERLSLGGDIAVGDGGDRGE